MKKITRLTAILCTLILLSCSNEIIDESSQRNNEAELQNILTSITNEEPCVTVNLIAGQHHTAGAITIDVLDDFLVVTYTTSEDWTIGTTHLSIGLCDDDWVPTTGSGNPKIGHFEFTEPFSESANEVIYIIPITDVGDNYCFAAHAEVDGPTGGETAWGEGTEFDGNSWAMYSEFNLSDCNSVNQPY